MKPAQGAGTGERDVIRWGIDRKGNPRMFTHAFLAHTLRGTVIDACLHDALDRSLLIDSWIDIPELCQPRKPWPNMSRRHIHLPRHPSELFLIRSIEPEKGGHLTVEYRTSYFKVMRKCFPVSSGWMERTS